MSHGSKKTLGAVGRVEGKGCGEGEEGGGVCVADGRFEGSEHVSTGHVPPAPALMMWHSSASTVGLVRERGRGSVGADET